MIQILIRGELTKTEKAALQELDLRMKTSGLYSDKERKQWISIIENTITLLIRPKRKLL